jgi:hypothetical protein
MQWSRNILDVLSKAALPAEVLGHQSNAIHVDNAASAIVRICRGVVERGVYNLVDCPKTTWGDVIAWHSDVVKPGTAEAYIPAGATIPSASSQMSAELFRWLKTLPFSFASACPSIAETAKVALRRYAPGLALSARIAYKRRFVRETGRSLLVLPLVFFMPSVPGRCFEYPDARPSMSDALCTWYMRISDPLAVANYCSSLTRGLTPN